MRFGPKCQKGSLPVFSVDSEDDARRLLALACERNGYGDYIARELVREQTLPNLQAFSDRLARVWAWMQRQNGNATPVLDRPGRQPPGIK